MSDRQVWIVELGRVIAEAVTETQQDEMDDRGAVQPGSLGAAAALQSLRESLEHLAAAHQHR